MALAVAGVFAWACPLALAAAPPPDAHHAIGAVIDHDATVTALTWAPPVRIAPAADRADRASEIRVRPPIAPVHLQIASVQTPLGARAPPMLFA
jgi:hypothetical protein